MNNTENKNLKISIEVAQKFEFYFLALVFTILGLSVQTSSFTKDYFQYLFEISALFSLLVSGLAGLSRIEWMPVVYRHYGCLQQDQRDLDLLSEGLKGKSIMKPSGEVWPVNELAEEKKELENSISKRKKESEKVDKWSLRKYKIHKWSFFLAIICLVVSRTLYNFTKLNL